MPKKLYLASQSVQRGRMLKEAGLIFEAISQDADERSCDWGMPLQKLTTHIAELKMDAAQVPQGLSKGEQCWIITADSLCVDKNGEVFGKPKDHEDAVRMVKSIRDGASAGSAFCIDRRVWDGAEWRIEERQYGYGQGECFLDVPDNIIEWYFKELKMQAGLDYMKLAGAFTITTLGAQFLRRVDGSYTAILGFPMYELRLSLAKTGFYN